MDFDSLFKEIVAIHNCRNSEDLEERVKRLFEPSAKIKRWHHVELNVNQFIQDYRYDGGIQGNAKLVYSRNFEKRGVLAMESHCEISGCFGLTIWTMEISNALICNLDIDSSGCYY